MNVKSLKKQSVLALLKLETLEWMKCQLTHALSIVLVYRMNVDLVLTLCQQLCMFFSKNKITNQTLSE